MRRRGQCPLCREPAVEAFAPFCSRGCRDRDLLAWFGEAYRTPARSDYEGDGGEERPEDDA